MAEGEDEMSTLRWRAEQFSEHTAKLGRVMDSAPRKIQIATPAPLIAKRQKYGNKITTDADGTKHASRKQALRYRDLGLLMKSGEILMLAREVRFRLPGAIEYRADHVFCSQRGLEVIAGLIESGDVTVEDVKSTATKADKVYRLKAKQMRECLGIPVTEI
jgi:hypothetical protein